jgi:hypothetical protein
MLDSGCCGTQFEKEKVNVIGSLLFAYPLLVLALVWNFMCAPFSIIFAKVRIFNLTLLRAISKTISAATLMTKFKCRFSASFYRISPRASGIVFKYFNHAIYTTIYLACIKLVHTGLS